MSIMTCQMFSSSIVESHPRYCANGLSTCGSRLVDPVGGGDVNEIVAVMDFGEFSCLGNKMGRSMGNGDVNIGPEGRHAREHVV